MNYAIKITALKMQVPIYTSLSCDFLFNKNTIEPINQFNYYIMF